MPANDFTDREARLADADDFTNKWFLNFGGYGLLGAKTRIQVTVMNCRSLKISLPNLIPCTIIQIQALR